MFGREDSRAGHIHAPGPALGEPGHAHFIRVASRQFYLDIKHKQKLGQEPQETKSARSL